MTRQASSTGTSHHIYDGEANVGAATNHLIARYDVSNDGSDLSAKVQQFDANREPHGY